VSDQLRGRLKLHASPLESAGLLRGWYEMTALLCCVLMSRHATLQSSNVWSYVCMLYVYTP
jgi:hypothetical protein